ncbi:MAG: hypothetical protein ACK46L_08005 [Synechococcaceae cyanobacterium]
MTDSRRTWRRMVAAAACLSAALLLPLRAQAEPPQALAILLKQLQAKPMGLYDGVRFFRIAQPGGGSLTLTVSCEREQWRVQNSDSAKGQPSFYDAPFLPAKGIARSWVCTAPARVME